MAIEDALTLSTLLTPDLQAEDIPGRLKLYERIRKPRVGRVRDVSRDIAKGLENPQSMRDYKHFLASHDPVEHAKQALSEYLEAKS